MDSYELGYNVGYAFGGVFLILTLILILIVSIFSIICMWKIFDKADEHGWAILIPLYSVYVLFKIAFGNGWKSLLLLIPIVNIVFLIMANFKLAKSFGKSTAFGFGLLFLPLFFIPILAFGDSYYLGPEY